MGGDVFRPTSRYSVVSRMLQSILLIVLFPVGIVENAQCTGSLKAPEATRRELVLHFLEHLEIVSVVLLIHALLL